MATFVDTSALYALIVADDPGHEAVKRTLDGLWVEGEPLVTHSYVLAETIALLQRRIGLLAVRRLGHLLPLLTIHWIGRELHERAFERVLASERREVSLVDHVSFLLMHDEGIDRAFAFDRDFVDQGFEVIPG